MPDGTQFKADKMLALHHDFEITNHDEEWVPDFSADCGGQDGMFLEVTTLEAEVEDLRTGNVETVDRKRLVEIFGDTAVREAEDSLALERSD